MAEQSVAPVLSSSDSKANGRPTIIGLGVPVVTIDVINAERYACAVIRSFRDVETRKVFEREWARKLPPEVQRRAHRKLLLLDAAERLEDLRVPPGNRLERLTGNRAGQHSIRINDQWRICFRWKEGDAHDVEICDYH
jgi:proteic killer suppression protein